MTPLMQGLETDLCLARYAKSEEVTSVQTSPYPAPARG